MAAQSLEPSAAFKAEVAKYPGLELDLAFQKWSHNTDEDIKVFVARFAVIRGKPRDPNIKPYEAPPEEPPKRGR